MPDERRGAWSFRAKLLFWMLIAALLPGGIGGVVAYRVARHALVDATEARVRALAHSRRQLVSSWLSERASDLRLLARSRECAEHLSMGAEEHAHQVCSYLVTFRKRTGSYAALSLFDPSWRWVAGAGEGSEEWGEEVAPQLAVARVLPAPGLPLVATERGPLLTIASQLEVGEGRIVGFVVAGVDLRESLWPLLADRTGMGRSGTAFVQGEDGTYFSPFRGQTTAVGSADSAARSEGVRTYRDSRGEAVIGAIAVLPDHGWRVVVEIEVAEALAPLDSLWRQTLLVVLATLVIAAVAGLAISRRLSGPMAALASLARRIGGGELEARAPLAGDLETQEVARAFNQMLDTLEANRAKVERSVALAAVGQLSAQLVHQLRNPLSTVKLNLQTLAAGLPSEDAALGSLALEQVQRLERMTVELLRFGHPRQPQPERSTVAQLLQEAIQLSAASVDKSGANVVSQHIELEVQVDVQLTVDVLSNLIANACEAGPPGGLVRVEAALAVDGYWQVDIIDSGPGISEAVRPRVLEPFFTTRRKGTGLGLAIAARYAEMQGGSLRLLESAGVESRGAHFRLELPTVVVSQPSDLSGRSSP